MVRLLLLSMTGVTELALARPRPGTVATVAPLAYGNERTISKVYLSR